MSEFARTIKGLQAYHNFVSTPVVFVEGQDDITFYSNVFEGHNLKLIPAGCKNACKKLADDKGFRSKPHIVIMDGDYEVIKQKRTAHKRIIYLKRYAVENYLLEKSSINQVCCSLAHLHHKEFDLVKELDNLDSLLKCELEQLIATDICNQRLGKGLSVVPNPGQLFSGCSKQLVAIDTDLVQGRLKELDKLIPTRIRSSVKKELGAFTSANRFCDVIPGHHVLHMTALVVRSALKREKKKAHFDNKTLFCMLCQQVWSRSLPADHRRLKRQLRVAVADARKYCV